MKSGIIYGYRRNVRLQSAFFVETFAKLSLIDQHVLQDSLELETSFINVNAIAETSALTAIRMDLVAEMPNLRSIDIIFFLSTGKGQWNFTRWLEMQKHMRHVTQANGRRCTNGEFNATVVKTYGIVKWGNCLKTLQQ